MRANSQVLDYTNINLCKATIAQDSSKLIANACANKTTIIIAGIKALNAFAARLGIEFDPASAQELLNAAKPLKIADFYIYFTNKPERAQAQAILLDAKQYNPNLILAIGGGVACDVAKLVASMLNLSIITLPSIAATCAASSALSVLYKDHILDDFAIYEDLNLQMIVDINVLKAAPKRYLLAGIGDTMAKFYECHLQMQSERLDYANALGKNISILCKELLIDADLNEDFERIIMCNLLNTGLVSRLIKPEFNGALAHAVCYALSAQHASGLHGELVAFGILVQLAILGDEQGFSELKASLKRFNMPNSLSDFMPVSNFNAERFVQDILQAPDVQHLLQKQIDLSPLTTIAAKLHEL